MYESFEAAIESVKDARAYQMREWPHTAQENAGGRPFEEWYTLLVHYMNKMAEVYTGTPGNKAVESGTGKWVPNIEGRKRVKKYMAIIANLAIWGVQSAMGTAGKQD